MRSRSVFTLSPTALIARSRKQYAAEAYLLRLGDRAR